jgi:hypothetical protein
LKWLSLWFNVALRLECTWGWVAVPVLIFVLPKDAFRGKPKRMMTGDQRQYKVAAKTRFTDPTAMEKPLGRPKKIEQFFGDYR